MILLVGVTGSGKSTTGNCLYNKSGQMKNITYSPFLTSDQASGVTKSFEMISKDGITILDTIGYGDPQYKDQPDVTAEGMSEMLERVDYKVDCVIFVVKKGRFSQEVVEFFRDIQEKVLKNKCEANSILLVTDCSKKGWVDEQKSNEYMKRALKSCQDRYFEFHLKFDLEEDDDDDKMKNLEKRQKAIDELVRYVDSLDFKKITFIYKPKQEAELIKLKEDQAKTEGELKIVKAKLEEDLFRLTEINKKGKAEDQVREMLDRERVRLERERERLEHEKEMQDQEIVRQRERYEQEIARIKKETETEIDSTDGKLSLYRKVK